MAAIHRTAIGTMNIAFAAPLRVTFGFQARRQEFSIWYKSTDKKDATYMVVPTGQEISERFELVASVVMDDGFTVFHLVRILE